MEHVEVIVIGAGSSGGVVASRLTEDPTRHVLLLEAGPDFPDEHEVPPLFAVSGEHSWLVAGAPELDWRYWNADRAQATAGQRVRLARGKLVGGTSMVNATIAARGAPYDYDRWERMGNPGGSWADILPYMIRIETDLDFGDLPYHGSEGPIRVQRYPRETWAEVNRAFFDGCLELGFRHAPDLNAPDAMDGVVGPLAHNRFNEIRQGTLVTYLREARQRPNLTIRGGATVDRVLIEGDRAVGVRYVDGLGQARDVFADTVVVSAGVYGSPAILQRSGIGRSRVLKPLGIDQKADLPVGEHLLDHPGCAFFFHAPALSGATGRLFAANARGPKAASGELEWQVHPFPIGHETGKAGLWIYLPRQDAEGAVEITSADPTTPPLIDHCYNTQDSDFRRFDLALDFCEQLIQTPSFAKHGARSLMGDASHRDIVRAGIASANHQAGTCKMGPASDKTSVVGSDLNIHGVSNLMVADASIFPDNIMHNTNFTCMVVGEIAADLVSGKRVAR